ncbi:hypothetical protein EI42_04309 [Thermosporothrix hazakensis]|jgi:tetratricopeptide (TPR) repeat protein|uniref:Tetratricopeptide repeat protein n=1 Tax=Thermosporothrix hazakensis TaxID=644383 RepID=A0A326U350_THEHA|nr:hypothetical protein [Thermosporothrix hazakensis]PZW25257.1 hypothetical protein EI42_04309 [Thermosporothrix hazakensis]GCE50491.1 hypothetical protein KTH_53600 [Thermosporothrix hazakensis]
MLKGQKAPKYVDLSAFTHKANVLREWRLNKLHWYNTSEVVILYNELLTILGEKPVSKRWWERLESSNKAPIDEKRRWILHTILNIPPAYLGLQTLNTQSLDKILYLPVTYKTPSLNVEAYKERITAFWKNPYNNFDEVVSRIHALQDYILYRDHSDTTVRVLCEYLIAAANMQRAQGFLQSAEGYIKKAIELAEDRGFQAQKAKSLYLRSYIYREKWRVGFEKDPQDIYKALDLSKQALHVAENYMIPPILESAIRFSVASEMSSIPLSPTELSIAKQQYDIARVIADEHVQEEFPLFFKIDKSWYTLAMAQMHLNLKEPYSALDKLQEMPPVHPKMRRVLTATVAEAEATIQSGFLDEGIKIAEKALGAAKQSSLHLARLYNLYQALRNDEKYTKEPYVIKFGFKLLRIQRPDLFQ